MSKHGSSHRTAATGRDTIRQRFFLYFNPHATLRGLILIGSLVVFGYLLKASHFGTNLNEAWIDTAIRGQGMRGELLFFATGVLFTAVGLPRQVIAFLGGYAFGFLLGCALALLSTLVGAVVAFYYARLLGQGFVTSRFSSRLNNDTDFLHGSTFITSLLLRLLPVGSNLATNLIAGVLTVPALAFFAGSVIGYIPQTLVFALIGSGIHLDPEWRISIGVLLFIVSSMLGVWLYRRYRHYNSSGADIRSEIPDGAVRGKKC